MTSCRVAQPAVAEDSEATVIFATDLVSHVGRIWNPAG